MEDGGLSELRIEKSGDPFAARQRHRRRWLLAVAVLAAAGLAAALWKLRPAAEVRVTTVNLTYPSRALTVLNASGYVVAQRKAAVAPKITGRLVWLGVEEGTRVKSGEIIARLDSADVRAARQRAEASLAVTQASLATARANRDQSRAALEEARAELAQARAEEEDADRSFRRQKELLAVGITTRADYDAAEARFRRASAAVVGARAGVAASQRAVTAAGSEVTGAESSVAMARAALREADVQVEYSVLRAPFDGVVLTKNADLGDVVTPIGSAANAKAAVVTMADLDSVQVEADVSESNLAKIRVGQACEVILDALPGRRFPAVLQTVVPTADRSKGTVMTKVRFLERDPRILPEMSAKVAFLERPLRKDETEPRLTVAPSAVVTRGGMRVVFVVDAGRVRRTPVTLGGRLGDDLVVTSGLREGERVVLAPPARLRDGAKVAVTEG